MRARGKWYDAVEKGVDYLKDECFKYRVYVVKGIIKVISDLSPKCQECRNAQENITQLTKDIHCISKILKRILSDFLRTLNQVAQHLYPSYEQVLFKLINLTG